jgi:hypothetical protein
MLTSLAPAMDKSIYCHWPSNGGGNGEVYAASVCNIAWCVEVRTCSIEIPVLKFALMIEIIGARGNVGV